MPTEALKHPVFGIRIQQHANNKIMQALSAKQSSEPQANLSLHWAHIMQCWPYDDRNAEMNECRTTTLFNLRGALAVQLRRKDRKTYPKQCVRHFEIDTPFQCGQSKSNPFQCSKYKRLLSYFCNILAESSWTEILSGQKFCSTFCKICKMHTLFLQKIAFSYPKI